MWRDTQRTIGIFGMDAWALAPLLFWLAHWRWWTFGVSVVGVGFFVALQWFGLSIVAAMRRTRCWLVGRHRPAVPAWRRSWFA